MMKLEFTLNGKQVAVETSPDQRLIDLLRSDFGLTGTKEGCGTGECGACTIQVDGKPCLSCLMLASQVQNRDVKTIEGMSKDENSLHPLQEAFVESGAVQCGFCTPGMIMSLSAYLEQHPEPQADGIRKAVSGNLCRCTGYQKIVDAGLNTVQKIKSPKRKASHD